ncbi:hypothetical protein MKD33_19235, partial [Chromobacterium piscinae]
GRIKVQFHWQRP